MNQALGISRNVVKSIIGEFIRCKLITLPVWAKHHRVDLATELKIPPEEFSALVVSEYDEYNQSILFKLNDVPFEIIIRTKRTSSGDDRTTMESLNGSSQAIMRRVLYSFLEHYVEQMPIWLKDEDNRRQIARAVRIPPSVLRELADEYCVSTPYSFPLELTWLEYRIELIVRAKVR